MENKEIIKAIENDSIFDFIANNYWKMDKFDLRCILLEYIYALSEIEHNRIESWEAPDSIIESLKDTWDIE